MRRWLFRLGWALLGALILTRIGGSTVTALLVTLLVFAVIALPAYMAGRAHERRRRRGLRGGYVAVSRPRAPAREVIREARAVARQPRFGDEPAGGFPRSEP